MDGGGDLQQGRRARAHTRHTLLPPPYLCANLYRCSDCTDNLNFPPSVGIVIKKPTKQITSHIYWSMFEPSARELEWEFKALPGGLWAWPLTPGSGSSREGCDYSSEQGEEMRDVMSRWMCTCFLLFCVKWYLFTLRLNVKTRVDRWRKSSMTLAGILMALIWEMSL